MCDGIAEKHLGLGRLQGLLSELLEKHSEKVMTEWIPAAAACAAMAHLAVHLATMVGFPLRLLMSGCPRAAGKKEREKEERMLSGLPMIYE